MRYIGTLNRLATAVATALYGATALVRAGQADTSAALEEIVVTATRRDTSVLDIPYSIQAVTGQDLAKAGISDISNLVRLAPGLAIFDEGPRVSGNRNSFNIRGLNASNAYNNDDNPSLTSPAVSTYWGETPVFFPFKLVDMNRVEVLRGPQGTLYGESSIGGTIRFIPNAPDPKNLTAEVNAKVSKTEHANEPSYDGSLTVNVPLNDRSAVRATVGHEYLSGFIDAVGLVRQTGSAMNPGSVILQNPADILGSPAATAPAVNDYNKADLDYFRGSLSVGITDRISATLNLVYQDTHSDGRYEDNPYYGNGRNYQYYTAFTGPQTSTIKLYDLDVTADLGFATLTSATGASNLHSKGVSDSSGFLRTNLSSYYFGYPRLYAPLKRTQEFDTYSQELRLVSKDTQRVDWIVGAFFKSSHTDFHLLQTVSGINAYTNAYLGLTAPIDFTDTLAQGYTSTTAKDIAGFGELTWHPTDRWQITGGARVFHDTLSGTSGVPLPYASLTTQYFQSGVANNPYLLGGFLPVSSHDSDHIFKFDTSYKFGDAALVYATVSQGYRPGGANALPAMDPLGNDNRPYLYFKPDTDTNYEVGIKGRIGHRFDYLATAFLVDWQHFQATLYTPFAVNYVANVAPARSQGIELEFNGNLTRDLAVGVNYTYIDAYVRNSFDTQQGAPATLVPARSPLPGSAKNTYSWYAEYHAPLPSSELVLRIDESYRGPSQSNFNNITSLPTNNFVNFSSISVWNSSVTWNKEPYSVGIYGENLSDSRGTSIASSARFYGPRDQSYGVIRPRTFGLRFNWRYK